MDEFARLNRIIATESAALAPVVERVNGKNMRADLMETFGSAAGAFARGRYSREEFHGITKSLIGDAWHLITEQDQKAEGFTLAGPEHGKREPWATMPTDGSGRLQWIDRVVIWTTVVGIVLALAWVAGLRVGHVRGEDSRTAPVSVSTAERDRELIIQGGSMSWAAFTECGNGPAACDAILRELNANPYGVRVFEDGSLIEVERTEDTFKVTMSGPTYGN